MVIQKLVAHLSYRRSKYAWASVLISRHSEIYVKNIHGSLHKILKSIPPSYMMIITTDIFSEKACIG